MTSLSIRLHRAPAPPRSPVAWFVPGKDPNVWLQSMFRWQLLLRPLGAVRLASALQATIIGFGLSALLPARPGEVVRPYLLARREGISAAGAFATILLERLLYFDTGAEGDLEPETVLFKRPPVVH